MATKKQAKKEVAEMPTPAPTESKVSVEEPKFDAIKVNLMSKNPLSRVQVTESEIDENSDVLFPTLERAKSYAKNEMLLLKDGMDAEKYNDLKWKVELFS